MAEKFLELKQVTVKFAGIIALDSINLKINYGEHWAIIGPSGSGKTVLANTLAGRHFHLGEIQFLLKDQQQTLHISIVEQQHRFKNLSNTSDLYYQQRFNSSDADQTITVMQELEEYVSAKEMENAQWPDELHIRNLFQKPLIQLSNGENKRVQLAIALFSDPELLIMDNPFLGLDTEGRKTLHHIINMLCRKGMHILLITSPHEIPEVISHVAEFENVRLIYADTKEKYRQTEKKREAFVFDPGLIENLKQKNVATFSLVVKMNHVHIAYGENVILHDINWQVKIGERWGVSGPNGAGKSTLLSLISADNPQAYANDIYLFDRRRGSGESIWDIKQKIGFISPELHLYFDFSATCFEVIASGLFDTIGLFRLLSEEQEKKVLLWMKLLQLETLRTKRLQQISGGQQRLVLLARALIKNPPLLILDEPCQGLDEAQTENFKTLIDKICETFGSTLIYVSHYADQIPACVTHFLRLENGTARSRNKTKKTKQDIRNDKIASRLRR